ncbi:hypothetical protein AVEN_127653-1 [Araneus ventricosus]|uniref:Mos1 transposase HTH domain-containing protein n=1 Tax=Araneus ventricosus TaxID=182803 RepID=A0A4Y2D177_ARAVE|nr:hypothetical protein AVEN_229208-1 [Araneus ventricosus]GBM10437.1 hypothetical protein AVEN_116906-1 [Araneus ventricosus]GBM10441.1 hypothetical protein AVEN_120346-1 [Araneus ventricosus]GBM10448.1 hypothetical protein AVEN_127653-1 [Araneus ventricosus]
MDSSISAQRAVIQFLRAKGEHTSQIYRRMKGVYGEQCLARCTIFRWCQRYEAIRVTIKDLLRPGQAQVVTNSGTISDVDEFIRRIVGSPHVKLLLNCRTVHHIIHKKLGYGKVCAQWVPSICKRIRRRRKWVLPDP